MNSPYKTTSVFTELTLPAALRREHRTKAGAWGIIRVLEGELKLSFPDGRTGRLNPDLPGLIRPEETHWVEPIGRMRMQVEFYDSEPNITRN
jgi:tellurite resistance-related uncharacterized protein